MIQMCGFKITADTVSKDGTWLNEGRRQRKEAAGFMRNWKGRKRLVFEVGQQNKKVDE